MNHADAVAFFAEIFGGAHHIPGAKYKGENVREWGQGWCILVSAELYTYDFDLLTRLVFLAHDRCCRVQVQPAMRYTRVCVWQRDPASVSRYDRHPTLDQALRVWRANYPLDAAP